MYAIVYNIIQQYQRVLYDYSHISPTTQRTCRSSRQHSRGNTAASFFHHSKMLESYIDDYADLQVALDRLHDVADPVVSSKEMRKSLGL